MKKEEEKIEEEFDHRKNRTETRKVIKVQKIRGRYLIGIQKEYKDKNGVWRPVVIRNRKTVKGIWFPIELLRKFYEAMAKVIKKLLGKEFKFPHEAKNIRELAELEMKYKEKILRLEEERDAYRHRLEIVEKEKKMVEELLEKARLEKEKMKIEMIEKYYTYFSNKLREFKHLIEDEKTTHNDIKRFLIENIWLISLEYKEIEPEKRVGEDIIDLFIKKPFQQVIVEIKLPKDPIFLEKSSKRLYLSSKVMKAISQIIDYMETTTEISRVRRMGEKLRIEESPIKGIILIGRTKNEKEERFISSLNSNHFLSFKILSYDMLLKIRIREIENLKKLAKTSFGG